MSDAVYCFDVDDCLEIGGQGRMPSTAGPVTIASIRAEAAPPDGDICGIVGNWINLPDLIPDWRDFLKFLLPPIPSNSHKGFWLAWIKAQYPGYQHYVMIGNDPSSHDTRPAYWDQQWPGTLPVAHIPGDKLLSDDIKAAAQAGFEFIREDDWARGQRTGTIPPREDIFYQFPKDVRPPMETKVYQIPGAVKAVNYDNGTVEAIVSVTGNLDRQKDIIVPGAYSRALSAGERLPKIFKQHDFKVWLGKTVDAEELQPGSMILPDGLRNAGYGGTYVKGEFTLEDPIAAAVHAHLKRGVIDEFSVGFDVAEDDQGNRSEEFKNGVRHIKMIYPWIEWSPVVMGANPATMPLSVKEQVTGQLAALEVLEEAVRALGIDERTAYMLGLKSDVSTQGKRRAARFSMRVGGKVKYPINDCSDVRDAWALRGRSSIPTARVAAYVRRAASKLGCNGPWNSGKEADEAVEVILRYEADQLARIEKAYDALTLGVHAMRELAQKDADLSDPTIDELDVPELSLKELEEISATAAAAYLRRKTQLM